MIFVTVGSMMGFDRLIRAMDEWTKRQQCVDVFAQIGNGKYLPVNMRWARMLTPTEFRKTVHSADLLVAHAGMGSFFVAMESNKPIVMMPRLLSLLEHTTDHQVHTLAWLGLKAGVYPAASEEDLSRAIGSAFGADTIFQQFNPFAQPQFVARLRDYIIG